MMNYLATLCVFVSLSMWTCQAQDETSHKAAAIELLTLMKMDQSMQQGIDLALGSQIQQNPNLAAYEDVLRGFLSKYMTWTFLKDRVAQLYVNEFTEGEIRSMIDFYTTDVGKKAIEKLPILMKKGSDLGQDAVKEHMAELTDAIQKRSEELNAK